MRLSVGLALGYCICMRLFELALSNTNAERLDTKPVPGDGFLGIAAVQVLWLAGMAAEDVFVGPRWGFVTPLFVVFLLSEVVRFLCMASLGMRWNIRVLRVDSPPIRRGLYKWFRHPNYFAVVVGMVALPLALGLFITPFIILPLKLAALKRRLRVEAEVVS